MSPHKFTLGQKVMVRVGSAEGHIPSGVYTISRILPGDDFDRAYRVLHSKDGHERVVREKQLEGCDWSGNPQNGPIQATAPAPRATERRIGQLARNMTARRES